MKKTTTLIALLALALQSFATKEISLSTTPLESSMNYGTYSFYVTSYIDGRTNKTKPVGYTRVGMANKKDTLQLTKNFASHCALFFKNMSEGKRIKTNVLAVINQIT